MPPGSKDPYGITFSKTERKVAAEEIAIKERILRTHAELLSDADKVFIQKQISHLREYGASYGY